MADISSPLCSTCNQRYSIYTCPGCSARTCSLPCSSSHKSTSGCTGLRNKAAYVPMNKYGWGTMMDDYVFLEELGRKVGDWGMEIVKGGFDMRRIGDSRGRDVHGRGRGRGRGGNGGGGGGKTKRDFLKIQLEVRDIEMDLLPIGMERRRINQSTWDFRNRTAFLTIELKFYPPVDPFAPSSQPQSPPFVILTHRNNITTPLITLLQSHMKGRTNSKKESSPEWIKSFLLPDPDDPDSFTLPQCVMMAQLNPLSAAALKSQNKAAYYQFDASKPLGVLLRNTRFVEFPTIEIWDKFHGTVVDTEGAVTQYPVEDDRKLKRRKLSNKAGKEAINGLLGGYGSDSDDNADDSHNVMAILGEYSGSDNEDIVSENEASMEVEDELGDEDADGDTDDEVEIDPAVLLELMRHAQDSEKWAENVGDDAIDWGDSEEGEPE